jgi:hypothetical protein
MIISTTVSSTCFSSPSSPHPVHRPGARLAPGPPARCSENDGIFNTSASLSRIFDLRSVAKPAWSEVDFSERSLVARSGSVLSTWRHSMTQFNWSNIIELCYVRTALSDVWLHFEKLSKKEDEDHPAGKCLHLNRLKNDISRPFPWFSVICESR